MSRFNYKHKYPDKTPQDEEFVKRVILDRKTRQKNRAKPGGDAAKQATASATNSVWSDDEDLKADGGVTLTTSEILDFAEGADSD